MIHRNVIFLNEPGWTTEKHKRNTSVCSKENHNACHEYEFSVSVKNILAIQFLAARFYKIFINSWVIIDMYFTWQSMIILLTKKKHATIIIKKRHIHEWKIFLVPCDSNFSTKFFKAKYLLLCAGLWGDVVTYMS